MQCHRAPLAAAPNMLVGRGCLRDVETVKVRLARGYSQSAPRYDALAGHLYLTGIRRLLPRVRVAPGPAVLDVGCGTGVNLLEAARQFAPTSLLCGIDISPGMVEVARAKAGALGLPADIRVGDAEQLPFPDTTFDLVICNSVLHWFDPVHDRRKRLTCPWSPWETRFRSCADAAMVRVTPFRSSTARATFSAEAAVSLNVSAIP